MSVALVDDHLLGAVLRGVTPADLAGRDLFTTGHWYVRLCQAVFRADHRYGTLSRPFAEHPEEIRKRAVRAVIELPPVIGLVSLRHLAPRIGQTRQSLKLNMLGAEVLAAAEELGSEVHLSADYPRLEAALADRAIAVVRHTP